MTADEEVAALTREGALDKVKEYRQCSREMVGSLYPNVLQDHVQQFLELCVARWGEGFMKCVERERSEETYGKDIVDRVYGERGRR